VSSFLVVITAPVHLICPHFQSSEKADKMVDDGRDTGGRSRVKKTAWEKEEGRREEKQASCSVPREMGTSYRCPTE
jgi:hypothetical protein